MGWNNQAVSLIILTEVTGEFSGVFGYSPAPGANNLVFSDAAGPGTDPYGNEYFAGVTQYALFSGIYFATVLNSSGSGEVAGLQWYSSSTGQNGWALGSAFGNNGAGGLLAVLSGELPDFEIYGGDGGTYEVGHQEVVLSAQTITGTGYTNVATLQVADGYRYRVSGQILAGPNQAAGAVGIEFGGTAGVSSMDIAVVEYVSGSTGSLGVAGRVTALNTPETGTTFATTNPRIWQFDGTITPAALGTFTLRLACTGASDSYNIFGEGSYLRAEQIFF